MESTLLSTWFLFFSSGVSTEMNSSDFCENQENAMKELGLISTIQQLWSTVNYMPHWADWGRNSSIYFTRDKIKPFFESLPQGKRFIIYTQDLEGGRMVINIALSITIGESYRSSTNNEEVIDVIRITSKPSKASIDSLRVELWCRNDTYQMDIESIIRQHLEDKCSAVFQWRGLE